MASAAPVSASGGLSPLSVSSQSVSVRGAADSARCAVRCPASSRRGRTPAAPRPWRRARRRARPWSRPEAAPAGRSAAPAEQEWGGAGLRCGGAGGGRRVLEVGVEGERSRERGQGAAHVVDVAERLCKVLFPHFGRLFQAALRVGRDGGGRAGIRVCSQGAPGERRWAGEAPGGCRRMRTRKRGSCARTEIWHRNSQCLRDSSESHSSCFTIFRRCRAGAGLAPG